VLVMMQGRVRTFDVATNQLLLAKRLDDDSDNFFKAVFWWNIGIIKRLSKFVRKSCPLLNTEMNSK
jgi:hypothetical protein